MLRKGCFEISNMLLKQPFLIYFLFFLYTCSIPNINSKNIYLIENVPFYPQEEYNCGPASLTSVMNYWGSNVDLQEVTKEIFLNSVKGTLTIDMILYAQKKGFKVVQYKGNIDDLKNKIKNKLPLIVLVDKSLFFINVNHFMVVTGYTDEGVIVNSGNTKGKLINYDDFLNIWKKTNFWTLLITKM